MIYLLVDIRPSLLGVALSFFLSKKLSMKKFEINKLASKSTLRKALKGTSRVAHTHFHAG